MVIRNCKEKERKPRKREIRRKSGKRKKKIRPEKMWRLESRSTVTRKGTGRRTKKVRKEGIMTRKGSLKQKILRGATLQRNMGSRLVPRILLIALLTAIKGTIRAHPLKAVITLVSACVPSSRGEGCFLVGIVCFI